MKTRKNIIKAAFLAAAAMLMSACGGNAATTTATTAATTTTTAASTTTTAAVATTEATTEATTTATSAAEENTDKYTPALYKVSDEDSTVYLFGAIHCGNEDTLNFPSYVTDAYNDSDAVACELDASVLLTDMELANKLNKLTLCETGKTTVDYIDAEIFEKMKSTFRDMGIYNVLYELYKPGMWASVVSQYMVLASGLSADYGVDSYFVTSAKADGKEIIELETAKEQYEILFSGSNDENSIIMLYYTSKELIDEQVQLMTDMYGAWCTGNMTEFLSGVGNEELDIEECKALGATDGMIAAAEEYNNKMYSARNETMTEKTKELLDGEKNVFLTVGDAHVEAEDGIVNRLINEGYTVERVG